MSKVRINDLARELEVKSRAILDALTHVGVTEKKTHSSSLEEDEAERVRLHFQRSGKNGAGAARVDTSEPKQKIDWSRVSKPGDVLKAIQQRKDEAAAMAQRPTVPTPVPPQAVKPPISVHPVAPASPVASAGPSPAVGVPPSAPRPAAGTQPASVTPSASAGQPQVSQAAAGQVPAGQVSSPRTGSSEPGWARSTYFSSTPARATADRSPA
jgi:translation initiation factor IF-2